MEKRKREWKGAQRLVNGRFKTGPPVRDWRSAEHQAACSTDRVLTGARGSRYLPLALVWVQDHGLAGKKPGHPGSSALQQRQESTSCKVLAP